MAACTFVITGTAAGTVKRIRQRVIGTVIGLPLGLACLLLAEHLPLAIWAAAALAMVIYAVAPAGAIRHCLRRVHHAGDYAGRQQRAASIR